MRQIAKLFRIGRSQAVRLPAEFRLEGKEVFIPQDPATGDVILSRRPDSWQEFFALADEANVLEDSWLNVTINRLRNASHSDQISVNQW